ncbi:MAG: hypothetical protein J6B98_07120 [Bacilli bacterium]|nr:hypothetical protein [Bacilli bacterium]
MNKKKLKIIATIIAFGLCFPLHFLFDLFPNIITSIFAPVNESIWEHMKVLFGSIILSGVIQKIYILVIKKEKLNNICFSNFIAAISSIPIFLILFLPVYFIIGNNFIVTIIIMLITIIISEFLSYLIMNKPDFKLENITIFMVIMVYIFFTILTYYPLKNFLFIDKKTSTYGIQINN